MGTELDDIPCSIPQVTVLEVQNAVEKVRTIKYPTLYRIRVKCGDFDGVTGQLYTVCSQSITTATFISAYGNERRLLILGVFKNKKG